MLVVGAVLIIGFIIILIELKGLKAIIGKKDLVLFSLFLLVGIGLNIMNGLHINLPYTLEWLVFVFQPISNLITRFLS